MKKSDMGHKINRILVSIACSVNVSSMAEKDVQSSIMIVIVPKEGFQIYVNPATVFVMESLVTHRPV